MSPHHGVCASEVLSTDLSPQLRHTLEFLRKLPFLPRTYLGDARPFLPPSAKPTLVLDLDETLVHCFRGSSLPEASPDLVVEFDESIGIGRIYFRPFVQLFLEVISRSFDVVVFTASQQAYADQVINALDPSGSLISHRLYRQHCTEFCGAYFKELSLLGRPLSKCILVDNSPISVACNAHNGVLIRSWYGDLQDQELLALLEVLEVGNSTRKKPRPLLRQVQSTGPPFRENEEGLESGKTCESARAFASPCARVGYAKREPCEPTTWGGKAKDEIYPPHCNPFSRKHCEGFFF
ncbi:unnamed protein product [Effrenium voratum]|nr:unnamed protein product [Effrenium voratum]